MVRVKTNLMKHEIMGLIFLFIGATWLGFGLYATMLGANRLLVAELPLLAGSEMLIFPIFYGIGAVLCMLGLIELREALPGKRRR